MKQIIVTVGREHGSGGKYIAEQIAKQLGIAFYDKELLLDSVFNAEDAARYDEKPVHLLWSRRIGENFNAPEDALAHETFDYIQKLADSGESFVVLGRCSDFILRSNPNAVHLFIAGKPDVKRRRLMEEKSLTADQAALEIQEASAVLGAAPTLMSATSPPLNMASVGIERTPNWAASSGFSSMFSLQTFSLP